MSCLNFEMFYLRGENDSFLHPTPSTFEFQFTKTILTLSECKLALVNRIVFHISQRNITAHLEIRTHITHLIIENLKCRERKSWWGVGRKKSESEGRGRGGWAKEER